MAKKNKFDFGLGAKIGILSGLLISYRLFGTSLFKTYCHDSVCIGINFWWTISLIIIGLIIGSGIENLINKIRGK